MGVDKILRYTIPLNFTKTNPLNKERNHKVKQPLKALVLSLFLSVAFFEGKAAEASSYLDLAKSAGYFTATRVLPIVNMAFSASQLPQIVQIIQSKCGDDVSKSALYMDMGSSFCAITTALVVGAPWDVWAPCFVPICFDIGTLAALQWVKWRRTQTSLVLKNGGIFEKNNISSRLTIQNIELIKCEEKCLYRMLVSAKSDFLEADLKALFQSYQTSASGYQSISFDADERLLKAAIWYHSNDFEKNDDGMLAVVHLEFAKDEDCENGKLLTASREAFLRCRISASECDRCIKAEHLARNPHTHPDGQVHY